MATRALRKDAGKNSGDGPKHDHVLRDFGGINTQAARQAISPDEFAWIENVMPIGHGNGQVVPARSPALNTVASGTCYFMGDYDLGGVNYMFMATNNGHAYQIALDAPYTRTLIGSGFGTFGLQIAGWSDTQLLIADPTNGLYAWDGTVLHAPGSVAAVTVTAGGSYTAIPTISFTGGGGVGAAAFAVMQLDGAQTITAAGTGYVAGDVLTLVGGTFTRVGRLKVLTIGGGGTVASVSILDPGEYTVLPGAPVATTGGAGTMATITPNYAVGTVTVTNAGTVPYTAAPTVVFSAGAATATAVLLQGPSNPEHIATFSSQVWISKGRTLYYSAPGSYYDFAGTGSGNTIITDETLHSSIQQLYPANGFLYFTGSHSVNVIGNVQVNTNGDTVFSNTNLSASVGSNQGASLVPYLRSLWFVNKAGVYTVYGSTPAKASDKLDGIFRLVDFTQEVSSGIMFLENILCAAFLVSYMDPYLGDTRPILLIYFGQKWFVGNQGTDLVFISTGELGDISNIYGTDGTSLFRLFDDSTMPVPWLIRSAMWDMQDVIRDKQVTKFGFECTLPANVGTVNVLLEGLQSTAPFYLSESVDVAVTSAVEWTNDADEVVAWTNNIGADVDWLGSGYFMNMQDGSMFGHYLGLTLSSADVIGSINSEMLEYTFRERW